MKRILYIGNKLSKKGNTLSTVESLGRKLNEEGFTVKTASSQKNKALRMIDMLRAVLKNRTWADVVLIDTYSTLNFQYAVAVAGLCRFYHIPYIPMLHGGNLPSRLQQSKKQSQKLFGKAKTNVAPSGYLLDAFKKEGYTNLTYIPNTIEVEQYPFLLRKELTPKLLWVRSFSKIYNPMLALQLLEALLEKGYTHAELCMIGPEKDGSLKECKAYAAQRKLPVTFTGGLPKTEWIERAKHFDLFINTTNVDNTPVSVIEAMALGLPVVSTKVGGVPFLIEDGIDGLLVPPKTVTGFATAIQQLLENKVDHQAISLQARKKAEHFDWHTVKEKWKTLLNG
ncbi:glycosyltransferase family 4 protein [Marixanthomonas spongiae]|uniref:Glycosyl transferase family 1 n=1 Tax=Marixanthomonas spongiae TaxID=2174845 RepID=A0A2U0I5U6_9FLAO|nr:glycosyltransferase family 4 protein [Marixanthomonas spongiae]PVW16476.1 glycosyl transferase family 1 [Marixanthomonas spongiae]